MAFNKNFDDETGYAASKDLPVVVAQYMQATGKSEEEVAKEILKAQEESKPVKGIVTPEDNGWTDLKKLGLWIKENANADEERNARAREAIAKSWNDYRDRTDPWFRVGLVNAIFGDNSMLNGYYNAMNSNAEAEKNRRAQMAYNAQIKATEDLNSTALKNAAAEKNFRDVIATIQDTGKALNNTQKNMVETAYKEMNDVGKEKYKEVMESLGLIKSEKESTEGSEAPRYGTDLNQKYTKDDVQNTKAEINMMSNGPEKLARAQELNQLILANQASVEGGLGNGFTPEELKKFGTVPKAPIKKGTKLGKDKDPKNNPQHFDAKLREWIKD